MDESGFQRKTLSSCQVAIWGLGLMGGSLAMALQGKCAGITGIDRDENVMRYAVDRHIVNSAGMDASRVLRGTDILILATPVRSILQILDELPGIFPGPLVIIDLGSTKCEVVNRMGALPDRFASIGGHPMCGKEKGSIRNADPGIFQGATFALVETDRSTAQAKFLAEEIIGAIGSIATWIEPDTHDRWVSMTSHAPYLLASALVANVSLDAAPLVGPGFRSTARVAGSPAGMMIDILATNRDHILEATRAIRACLERYENLLTTGHYSELEQELNQTAEQYRALIGEG